MFFFIDLLTKSLFGDQKTLNMLQILARLDSYDEHDYL